MPWTTLHFDVIMKPTLVSSNTQNCAAHDLSSLTHALRPLTQKPSDAYHHLIHFSWQDYHYKFNRFLLCSHQMSKPHATLIYKWTCDLTSNNWCRCLTKSRHSHTPLQSLAMWIPPKYQLKILLPTFLYLFLSIKVGKPFMAHPTNLLI